MKTKKYSYLFLITAAATTLLLTACGSKEQPAAAASPTMDEIKVPDPAAEAVATTADVPAMLEKLKGCIQRGDMTSASHCIGEISKVQLTPEQQAMFDELKAKVASGSNELLQDAQKMGSDLLKSAEEATDKAAEAGKDALNAAEEIVTPAPSK